MTDDSTAIQNAAIDSAAIRHDPAAHRFSVVVDGVQAHLDYTEDAGVMTMTHTRVPEAIGGRGIAGRLVQAALAHARSTGRQVVPQCSYVAAYLDRHPEHADLRAR